MPQSSTIAWPTAADLKRQFLEDIELQCVDAEIEAPPMGRGTHYDLVSTATSNEVSILSTNQQILDSDSSVLTATGEQLDEIRRSLGLPEVPASAGSGQLTVRCVGAGSIPKGLRFVAPNGMRGQTITSYTATTSGSKVVDVEMLDTGDDSNLTQNTIVRFEANPPNIATEATVYEDFAGGTDSESDERKRARILNRLENPPGGGNWSQMREVSMNASGSVGDVYIYPSLGGPSSAKVVCLSNTEVGTRVLTSLDTIISAINSEFPPEMWKLSVTSVTDQSVDVALYIEVPSWKASGPLYPSRVITSSGTSFTIDTIDSTNTAQGITAGDEVAYWSTVDFCFYTAQVLSVTNVGARQAIVNVSAWSGSGAGPVVNNYISPSFSDILAVGEAWISGLKKLGPGENIPTTDPRYTIAKRYPRPSATYPMRLTSLQLSEIQNTVSSIISVDFAYQSASAPGTPATVMDKPYVIIPRQFGVYPAP